MSWSESTKSVIATELIQEKNVDPYPDRDASANLTTSATTVMRLVDVNNTTKDMSRLFEWEHGTTIRGTKAKDHVGMKNYRKDINRAYGQEGKYKDFYVDTFLEVGAQLEKNPKRRKRR